MQKRPELEARSDEVMSWLQQPYLGNSSRELKKIKNQNKTEETPAGEKGRSRGF